VSVGILAVLGLKGKYQILYSLHSLEAIASLVHASLRNIPISVVILWYVYRLLHFYIRAPLRDKA